LTNKKKHQRKKGKGRKGKERREEGEVRVACADYTQTIAAITTYAIQ
jgi:hypothetical protein